MIATQPTDAADLADAEDALGAVRFVLDGQLVTVRDVPCTMTVLEYLREVAHRTGTKEGCAEGDCGACTVVLGELADDGSRVVYRTVNSCIRFLPTIDGQELVTVESLAQQDGQLHPVQQAMVDSHASQCGFCTPGFVMSLFALYLDNAPPGREQVQDALSGNFCRCTGYRPIIEAGCRMGAYPPPPHWHRDTPGHAGGGAAPRVAGHQARPGLAVNEQGWNRDATLRQLAHMERNSIRAAYNYAEHLPERRKMMQVWSDYLDTLKRRPDAGVREAA